MLRTAEGRRLLLLPPDHPYAGKLAPNAPGWRLAFAALSDATGNTLNERWRVSRTFGSPPIGEPLHEIRDPRHARQRWGRHRQRVLDGRLRGVGGIGGYVASKHGVIGLTKSVALDDARHGIRANAVAPGPIQSKRLALPDDQREQIVRAIPVQRVGCPEEVAAAVVWLCSDQASFITGATIPIDGGKLSAGA